RLGQHASSVSSVRQCQCHPAGDSQAAYERDCPAHGRSGGSGAGSAGHGVLLLRHAPEDQRSGADRQEQRRGRAWAHHANALAFTAAGVPLGLLSQTVWARQEVPEEGYQEKIERLQCTVVEEKESAKWLLALRETVARTPPGVKV